MFGRTWLAVGLVATSLVIPQPVQAIGTTTLSREQIRSLPITERPNRVGHFYGNAVRRQHGRGVR